LFADDLSVSAFGKNLDSLISELSEIMESLDNWCKERDLIISFAKTKYMIFSKKPLHNLTDSPPLFCNGNLIERVDSFKYLGIFFDSTLNFQSHFDHICSRVSSAVGCLLFIKRFLNVHTFKTLLNAFVLSIIDYGLIIWGKIPETKIKILQSKINNILEQHKSDFFEKSPTYQSSLIWNRLPNEAKELDVSLSGFKKIINEWLLKRRLDVFVSDS